MSESIFAIPSLKRYPLNTAEQVKTAQEYFDHNLVGLSMDERVEMAHNIKKRANDLSVKIASSNIINYSNCKSYSPEFERNMLMRKMACHTFNAKIDIGGNEIPAEKLVEKLAANYRDCKPTQMVQIIRDLDKKAGMDGLWNSEMRDPYFTVFGSTFNPNYDMEKYAEGITDETLRTFSTSPGAKDKLMVYFGENIAQDFIKDPVSVYKSFEYTEKEAMNNLIRG